VSLTQEQRFQLAGLVAALALHGGLAAFFALLPPEAPRPRTVVEVDIRRKPPPPPPVLTPPEPPRPPEPPQPERKLVKKLDRPPEAPRTTKPAPEPPKTATPVFGLSEKDTAADSSFAVPLGNTTMADPAKRPKGDAPPLPAGPAGTGYNPISEAELKVEPRQVDPEGCGAAMREDYNKSVAFAEGVEGQVVLRVELDGRGKPAKGMASVRVVKGLRADLDNLARSFLAWNARCRFSPALGKDGQPGAYVIERYIVNFELPR
jgi:hypothetical protein